MPADPGDVASRRPLAERPANAPPAARRPPAPAQRRRRDQADDRLAAVHQRDQGGPDGTPRRKFLVPSIGSRPTCAGWRRPSSPNSSPSTPSRGGCAARRAERLLHRHVGVGDRGQVGLLRHPEVLRPEARHGDGVGRVGEHMRQSQVVVEGGHGSHDRANPRPAASRMCPPCSLDWPSLPTELAPDLTPPRRTPIPSPRRLRSWLGARGRGADVPGGWCGPEGADLLGPGTRHGSACSPYSKCPNGFGGVSIPALALPVRSRRRRSHRRTRSSRRPRSRRCRLRVRCRSLRCPSQCRQSPRRLPCPRRLPSPRRICQARASRQARPPDPGTRGPAPARPAGTGRRAPVHHRRLDLQGHRAGGALPAAGRRRAGADRAHDLHPAGHRVELPARGTAAGGPEGLSQATRSWRSGPPRAPSRTRRCRSGGPGWRARRPGRRRGASISWRHLERLGGTSSAPSLTARSVMSSWLMGSAS